MHFTLTELLVVIAIIAILAAMFLLGVFLMDASYQTKFAMGLMGGYYSGDHGFG